MRKVKIKKGCQWFYTTYNVDGKKKEINLGIKIEGVRPVHISGLGDKAFEASKLKAIIAAEAFHKELNEPKSQERLARAVYAAQTGGRQPPNYNIDNLYTIWLKKSRKKPPTPQRQQLSKSRFDRFVRFMQEKYPAIKTALQVSPEMAREYLEIELSRGISPSTYNDILFNIKYVFERAQADAFAEEVPNRTAAPIHRIPFKIEEIIRIKEAAQNDAFLRPIIITAICTGMRLGDCCALKWSDIDFAQKVVRVKTNKTGEMVNIHIFDWLLDELAKHKPTKSDFVFPLQEQKYRSNPSYLGAHLKKVLRTVGFCDGTSAFSLGVDGVDISELTIRVDEYLKTLNAERAKKIKAVFDAYISGRSLNKASAVAGVCKSTTSVYLNELEQKTGTPFIRGRLRPVKAGHEKLNPITTARKNGLRKASTRLFHAFRTTWVTLALKRKIPIETVRLITGHATTAIVLKHYYNPDQDDIREALEKALPFTDKREVQI